MAAPTAQAEVPTAADPAAAPLRMTFEEYLAFDYEHGLAEWVNGEVICYISTTKWHQRVADFLLFVLTGFVRVRRLGSIISAPYGMRAKEGGSGREPDVMFIATGHLDRMGRTHLEGPADLVVEVVSDDSVTQDRDDKFSEYQDAGVREYWIIDPRPNRRRADFYVLNDRGRFDPVPIPDDNRYRSTVLPGFWLDVEWLWQEDPNELAALVAILGASQLPPSLTEPQRFAE
jgi:Uma2 family endonuclease